MSDPWPCLQMVGQKLLYHAATQLPALNSLPTRMSPWVLASLYVQPFAAALSLALQSLVDGAAVDSVPFVPEVPATPAQSRAYRSLTGGRFVRGTLAAGGRHTAPAFEHAS